jgi:hypothetical protein
VMEQFRPGEDVVIHVMRGSEKLELPLHLSLRTGE